MSKIDDIANKTFTIDKNGNITDISIGATKMSKELIEGFDFYDFGCLVAIEKSEWEEIQKERKALDIIKKKTVSITWLRDSEDRADYNYLSNKEDELTKEEYDLLKEMLL